MPRKKRKYRYLVNLLPAIKRRRKLKVLYKRGKLMEEKRPSELTKKK